MVLLGYHIKRSSTLLREVTCSFRGVLLPPPSLHTTYAGHVALVLAITSVKTKLLNHQATYLMSEISNANAKMFGHVLN